jgi:lipopolysaccharide export system protein LptA
VIQNRLPILLAAAIACSSAWAQSTGDKPLTEAELLKQIESLNPLKGAATPNPRATPAANSLFNSQSTGDIIKPPTDRASATGENGGKPGEKKAKGPTEITSAEATFDQKANVAVFVGSVVVKDPEFNVVCDKLTAFLKHDDKTAPSAVGAGAKTTPVPATPSPNGSAAPAKKGGGLDHAIAITTSDRRVIITQDKVEADGSITHGLGHADQATYDAVTGNIVLTGNPDVTQGVNRCIALAPETIMTLNRDGHMTAKGPTRTVIVDTESNRDGTKTTAQ